ncbi:MAG: HipA domain-containing protein [Venatoribacter sp.]
MIKRFDLYLNTQTTGLIKAAEVALLEEQQRLQQVGFRYTQDYLALPHAFALDPAQLPLSAREFNLTCQGSAPAVLDDYLPDDWGKKVLGKIALTQQLRLNTHCISDLLSFLQQAHSRIGALSIVEQGKQPSFLGGIELSKLQEAELSAQQIDQNNFAELDANTLGLIFLANSGSGVGGARPKTLLQDNGHYYLAKFNRHNDPYNNARVELACLNMARAAGIQIGQGKITTVNQREVLLLERFDIQENGRTHLITANGLLKSPANQLDPGQSFRYNDLHLLLQKYSADIEQDLHQLTRLMLFNSAINNTDDHERNFSFMHDDEGYRLAPAYDLVPSLGAGEYHAAGFNYQPYPPRISELSKLGSLFGLPKGIVSEIGEQVAQAIQSWACFAEQAKVTESETEKIARIFQL